MLNVYNEVMLNVIVCSNCKRLFKRYPSQVISDKTFCGKKCFAFFRLKHIYICELCKRTFHRPIRKNQKTPRFCSPKCMYSVLKIERNPLNCECKVCGKKFHKGAYSIAEGEGKYCSMSCRNKGRQGKRSGKSHYYSLVAWRKLRLKILERDNYACVRCGKMPKRLEVNHKLPRRIGGTDDPSNLESLCYSCHAIVDSLKRVELNGKKLGAMKSYQALLKTFLIDKEPSI